MLEACCRVVRTINCTRIELVFALQPSLSNGIEMRQGKSKVQTVQTIKILIGLGMFEGTLVETRLH